MIRYTTPSITLLVEDMDLTQGQDIYVSLEQGPEANPISLEKREADLTITTETHDLITDTSLVMVLSQAESAMFDLNAAVKVQVNWIDASGIRQATEIRNIPVFRNLLDRVIGYGD